MLYSCFLLGGFLKFVPCLLEFKTQIYVNTQKQLSLFVVCRFIVALSIY